MSILIIDDREMKIKKGQRLLHAIVDNGIYIPSLCCLKEMTKSPASCRLCFVEIEGRNNPVLSCTVDAEDGMIIRTDTPAVRRLQKTAFELILSTHHINCRECAVNKKCVLQTMAKFLNIPLKQKRIEYLNREIQIDNDHPYLIYDPFKCVMCGRCIFMCEKLHGKLFLSFAGRGLNMKISFFGETDPDKIPCNSCYACVDSCPVAALIRKSI
jgi:predicted molibdopterin-dependent oxidoreductase YjgC